MVNKMSMARSTDRIHDFLSTLTAAERKTLENSLAHTAVVNDAKASAIEAKKEWSPEEALFWDTMCEALRTMHLNTPGFGARENLINGKGGIGRAKYSECAIALHDYVTHACSARIDLTHKRAIYVEVLSCLIKWMRRTHISKDGHAYDIPLRPSTICDEIGSLPLAVNRCYPGYVKARLLHVIVPREADRGLIRGA